MRVLYSALLYLLVPFILLRMVLRSRRAPAYRRRLAERFGFFAVPEDVSARPAIWLHAVSLGETLAAAPIIEDLLSRYPAHQLVVTTTTPTGSERVQALFGERVFHVYAPWDLPGSVKRFLRAVQPQLLLIMETELWPNMLHYSATLNCPVLLANARLSERSARGYARFGRMTHNMLQSVACVACQSRADGERFVALGLPVERLQVTGSIKFDLELDATLRADANTLRQRWALPGRQILVAASTHPGEDEQILAAFASVRNSLDNCLLLLVPRHPERFDDVAKQCQDAGWQVCRRSAQADPSPNHDVVVGDTMGELLLLLSLADVAVIGGSLVPHGGHNVLEAAAWGVPVVTGPHMFNFMEISELLSTAGGMQILQRPDELAGVLLALLQDPARAQQMGLAGQQVVADNRGAKKQLLALLDRLLRAE